MIFYDKEKCEFSIILSYKVFPWPSPMTNRCLLSVKYWSMVFMKAKPIKIGTRESCRRLNIEYKQECIF